MPRSRGRSKQRQRQRPYVPKPQPKPRRSSPRWYGPLVLVIMGVGVGLIVWNYFRGVDGFDATFLFIGLGLIALGFGLATQWR